MTKVTLVPFVTDGQVLRPLQITLLLNPASMPQSFRYFPAIVCVVCDSPVDALVALCVRRDEAMRLVAASWSGAGAGCMVTTLHGGRPVAVLLTPEGRWAACNAFLEELFITPRAAQKRLDELLRRGRRGYIGQVLHLTDLA